MNRITRRSLITAASGLPLAWRWSWADGLPTDLRITRITGFDLVSQRNKVAGRNARRDVHGNRGHDRMVRIETNKGIEGLGCCRAPEKALANLLGQDPLAIFKSGEPSVTDRLGPHTMPMWDLAGKIMGKPVHELLGGAGPKKVPVYDGSIYFMDLLPQYADKWQDRLKREIDMGRAAGHTAFKVKIGRGHKWMPAEAGYARDLAVLKTIRGHAGADTTIGVDANLGYEPDRAKRLLADLPGYNIAFIEEPYHEDVEKFRDLKQFIRKNKLKTLIADGENWSAPTDCKPFVEAGVIDVLQADMRRLGFEGIVAEAAIARPHGARVAPHNWGSLIGFHMQLHVGRALDNFYMAEHDPLTTDLLIADGYKIKDGHATVPDAPGMGLKLNEKKLGSVKLRFDLKV